MKPETIIAADRKTRVIQYLLDLWQYRDLFRALVERDVKVRYKQTVLGVTWVLIVPLLFSVILSIFIVRVLKGDTQNLPPPLFFLAGMIPWACFSNGVSQAAGSMESGAGLISKIYFPRMIVPGAIVMSTVIDFSIGWLFFNVIAILWTLFPSLMVFGAENGALEGGYSAYWTWKFIPFTFILLCLQLSTAMGIALVLSALSAQYRDIRYVTPVLVQFGLFITPIMWPVNRLLKSGMLEGYANVFLYLNPMAGVIETYRGLLAESSYIPYKMLGANFCVAAALLSFGVWFFRKREQRLVDFL